jgi:hypothetical protein
MELQFERRVRQILGLLAENCDGLALGEVVSTDIRRTVNFIEVLAEFSLPRARARLLLYSPEEDGSNIRFVKCEIHLQPIRTLDDSIVFSQCYESAMELFGKERQRTKNVLGVHQEGYFQQFMEHYASFVSPFAEDYAPSDSVAIRRAA